MDFEKVGGFDNLEMAYISNLSGGFISKNHDIFREIELTDLNRLVLEKSVYGTPIFKMGSGGKRILISSGIHGNELPSQLANLKLMNEFADSDIQNTLFFIPFAAPKATMLNSRFFNALDLNRASHIKNSLSNVIVEKVKELKIDFVGDFHSTAYNSNPGCESVFSSKSPTPESYLIAEYVSRDVGCKLLATDFAGQPYKGAVEDVCNLLGIPAVTGEVLSPFSSVGVGSVRRSYIQMKSFLSYFGI